MLEEVVKKVGQNRRPIRRQPGVALVGEATHELRGQ